MPNCPLCGQPLKRVIQSPYSSLNNDQFDASKAGDWYCGCSNNERGNRAYAYFWDYEVTVTVPNKEKLVDNPHFTSEDVRHRLDNIRKDLKRGQETGALVSALQLRGYELALEWVLRCMESKDDIIDTKTNGG
jgi:hypothetical protein